MESLFAINNIELMDIEQVYAGLYLDMFTDFETVLEKLFIGLSDGSLYSKSHIIKCRIKIKPASLTKKVVFSNRPYVDWLPYKDRTIPRAKFWFENGEPFTILSQTNLRNLDDYCTLRNAIAHKSESAYDKFQGFVNGLPLLPQERTPSGYLRSKPYAYSAQTQFEIAVIELKQITNQLCHY